MINGIDQSQYAQLRQQGYTDEDIRTAIAQRDEAAGLAQSYANAGMVNDPRISAQHSMFNRSNDENLIKWQLELDSILERLEHILRGDQVSYRDGCTVWKPCDEKNRMMNDYGVNELLKIISSYLNRNTILSNYDEDTINFKVYDIGMEVSDLIFMKYEAMGLDTVEKRKLYPMMVRQMVDMVHSSYLRALHGGERDSLREARQITQTESMQPGLSINNMPVQRERGILNPMRYMFGRHK